MPRRGRVVLRGYPHHVVQRGHNRQRIFSLPQDYRYYLCSLKRWKNEFDVRLYGYCLMSNHVHLILEPDDDSGLGTLMKRVAARQTRYVNRQEKRSGTLWEGRYKSSPIDTDNYLLACCRYVELNPVRAGMIAKPEDYPWSSYRERMGLTTDIKLLDTPPALHAHLPIELTNRDSYREFVIRSTPEAEAALIREALQRGQLTGDAQFIDEIESRTGNRIERRGPGRVAARRGK